MKKSILLFRPKRSKKFIFTNGVSSETIFGFVNFILYFPGNAKSNLALNDVTCPYTHKSDRVSLQFWPCIPELIDQLVKRLDTCPKFFNFFSRWNFEDSSQFSGKNRSLRVFFIRPRFIFNRFKGINYSLVKNRPCHRFKHESLRNWPIGNRIFAARGLFGSVFKSQIFFILGWVSTTWKYDFNQRKFDLVKWRNFYDCVSKTNQSHYSQSVYSGGYIIQLISPEFLRYLKMYLTLASQN